MNNLFEMAGEIVIKMDGAVDDLEKVTDKAGETADSVVDKFKGAAKLLAGVFAVDKIFDFGKLAVEASAEAQALEAQFEQVFGNMQDEATSVIDDMSKEFGMLPNRIKPSFTQLTSMFKGVGMEASDAMDTAEQVTTSAADAAAFYDVSMESAQASLTSFIKGNYQAGESVGVFATDAQLAQFAIEQGVVSSTAEWQKLDEATKMATRADYVTNMQEMSGATGQAARESEEFENVMGNLKQAWQDFLAIVGAPILEAVIPIIQGVTTAIQEIPEVIDSVIERYQLWSAEHPILSSLLEGLIIGLGVVATAVGAYTLATTIATMATTAFATVMAVLTSPITLTIAAITALIAIVYTLWQNWETIGPMLSNIWNNVSTAVVGIVSDMWASITNWFSQIVSSVSAKTQEAYNSVVQWFTEMKNNTTQKVTDMYNSVVEWFGKIPGKVKEKWNEVTSFLEGINLFSIGTSIVQGLWDGIAGKWDEMVSWVSNAAANVTDTLKGVFQINSPAKVMIPIGSALPEGVAVGVEKGAKFVDKALNKLGSEVANTAFDVPEVAMTSDYTFKQQPTQAQRNNNNLLEEAVYLLRKISNKDTDININGRTLSEEILDDINYLNDLYSNRDTRIRGGVAYP